MCSVGGRPSDASWLLPMCRTSCAGRQGHRPPSDVCSLPPASKYHSCLLPPGRQSAAVSSYLSMGIWLAQFSVESSFAE